ncbi:hypothetical protein Ocin01_19989 [Orchesella cincta]|uniref:Uncharacterized protein n=1 Tax=Orchesella cincta TaxID=48709 RepID=A0A1D2M166_ORCCI|nr:hypothetical protein Ocin01_19989 [Orchesella cincta]
MGIHQELQERAALSSRGGGELLCPAATAEPTRSPRSSDRWTSFSSLHSGEVHAAAYQSANETALRRTYYNNQQAQGGAAEYYYDSDYRSKYYTSAPSAREPHPPTTHNSAPSTDMALRPTHPLRADMGSTMMDEYGNTTGAAAGSAMMGNPAAATGAAGPVVVDDYHSSGGSNRQQTHHRSRSASRLNRYSNTAMPTAGYDSSYYDEDPSMSYYGGQQGGGQHHMGGNPHPQQPVSILNRSRHASGPSVMSRNPSAMPPDGNNYLTELQLQNSDLQRSLRT